EQHPKGGCHDIDPPLNPVAAKESGRALAPGIPPYCRRDVILTADRVVAAALLSPSRHAALRDWAGAPPDSHGSRRGPSLAGGQAMKRGGVTAREPRVAPAPRVSLPAADSVETAEAAALRYVSDQTPGITRLGKAPRFRYRAADGSRVDDLATRRRIRALAI